MSHSFHLETPYHGLQVVNKGNMQFICCRRSEPPDHLEFFISQIIFGNAFFFFFFPGNLMLDTYIQEGKHGLKMSHNY